MNELFWYLLGLANGYIVALILLIFMVNNPENWEK